MAIEDAELVAEFVVESCEHLADIENELLEIEEGGANIDADLVNKVFRGIHSIKGAAGFLGLNSIKELAHVLENVLNKIRSNELVPTPEITSVMLKAGDKLNVLLDDAMNSNEVEVSEEIAALNCILSEEAESAPGTNPPNNDAPDKEDGKKPDTLPAESQPTALAEARGSTKPSQNDGPETSASGPPKSTQAATTPKTGGSSANIESSIRVPVGVLDHLMNLAGELVLSRNQLLQAVSSKDVTALDASSNDLDQVTSSLQEAIMQTRMQAIGSVFGKFPRIVRDLSSQLSKECTLEVEGKEVEVDKTIIEAIGDPLTHLIRNSVDHGVETPEVRMAAGKSSNGTVWLRAFHKAGKVCIEIQDDGAGINPEVLKRKAQEKGILSADRAEQMSDREALRLIFHPGFSTAEVVSDVSGRGVGMDVVRTNIEKLGGNVDIDSEIGVGTNICVTLPLTLAIIPSMIVRCGSDRFAIPQANVAELVRLRPGEVSSRIDRVKKAEVLRLRGSLLPLIRLDDSLGLKADNSESLDAPMSIVVVETGQLRYGLIVDGICDSEEIVVKPLGRHLKVCKGLAGATILGNGRVALILDASGIAAYAGVQLTHDSDDNSDDQRRDGIDSGNGHTLLLFSSDPADRFAVPMEVVSRIELVRADQIDSVGGHELLQYRGTSLPLVAVENHLSVNDRPSVDRVYVIVFTLGEREVGLIAPHLEDIREVGTPVDAETFQVPGVAGSLVIDGKATRLLDVFQLAELSHPQWFEEGRDDNEDDRPRRILLAEDSAFFRRQVAGFLAGEGFETVEYEDGAEAWAALSEGNVSVDLIVTDIEMPYMDGFELCRHVREHKTLKHIPVIALTSLSSDSDRDRGKSVGFNDYQVKMHRDNLIRSVRELFAEIEKNANPRHKTMVTSRS